MLVLSIEPIIEELDRKKRFLFPIETYNMRIIALLLCLATRSSKAYVAVPEDICPGNLHECLTGDNHVIACYQSVERIRVCAFLNQIFGYS